MIRAYLRQLDPIPRFLNTDELARGLSRFNVLAVAVKAGKLLLHGIDSCLKTGNSFGLESTLSGTTYTRTLQWAKALGYTIEIHYLWLPSPELAIRRIAQRVKMGGHFIPAADVRRRYKRSISNFINLYAPLANAWTFRKNRTQPPSLLFDSANSSTLSVESFQRPCGHPSRPIRDRCREYYGGNLEVLLGKGTDPQ